MMICEYFKKKLKKYKSIRDDFDTFKKVLAIDPRLTRSGERGVERVSGLGEKLEGIEIYKVKRFRCFSISKNSKDSGLRIIYHSCEGKGKIEFEKIEFIEIFHKNPIRSSQY